MIGLGQFANEGFVCSYGLFLVKRTLSLRIQMSRNTSMFQIVTAYRGCHETTSRSSAVSWHIKRGEVRTYEMIHIMGYHGFLDNALCNQSVEQRKITYRHLREVSTEDTRDIVGGIAFFPPIQILAVLIKVFSSLPKVRKVEQSYPRWRLKRRLKLAHAPVRPAHAEGARHFGGYNQLQ